jgi:hypothetical protein
LGANAKQAESAVVEAINAWDPGEETEEALFHRVLIRTIQAPLEYETSTTSFVPLDLQPVLGLSPQLRRCFVLRVLARLSRQVCARLLHLTALQVDQRTYKALESLSQAGLSAAHGRESGVWSQVFSLPAF